MAGNISTELELLGVFIFIKRVIEFGKLFISSNFYDRNCKLFCKIEDNEHFSELHASSLGLSNIIILKKQNIFLILM